jgi:hypothetical protein
MKKLLNAIGYILISPVIVLFILVLIGGGVGMLVLYVLPVFALAAMMRTIRKDPKVKLEIAETLDSNWQKADTPEEFIESFNGLLAVIAGKSGAKIGKFKREGFENLPQNDDGNDREVSLRMEKTLSSPHGSLSASLEFVYRKHGELYVAELEDDESRSGSGFPELQMEWRSSKGDRLLFTTGTDESVWFAIGLLNSGLKPSKARQAWVNLKEKDVWLVNYTVINPLKSDTIGYRYGLRSTFSERRAREYLLDK